MYGDILEEKISMGIVCLWSFVSFVGIYLNFNIDLKGENYLDY